MDFGRRPATGFPKGFKFLSRWGNHPTGALVGIPILGTDTPFCRSLPCLRGDRHQQRCQEDHEEAQGCCGAPFATACWPRGRTGLCRSAGYTGSRRLAALRRRPGPSSLRRPRAGEAHRPCLWRAHGPLASGPAPPPATRGAVPSRAGDKSALSRPLGSVMSDFWPQDLRMWLYVETASFER